MSAVFLHLLNSTSQNKGVSLRAFKKPATVIHKLVLDEIWDDEFALIAIHASVEDFKLAFFINQQLDFRLYKMPSDLDLIQNKRNTSYPIFKYEDPKQFVTYHLVGNTCEVTHNKLVASGGFFEDVQTEIVHLIPEIKKADYFLKVVTDEVETLQNKIINDLKNIPMVVTAYAVDHQKLKSKRNLNFD